jgi:hypothetical protein
VRRRSPGRSWEPSPSVAEPRAVLLAEVLAFVRAAAVCPGVIRIALVGSLATPKPIPKDADVLVTLEDGVDLTALATVARRLKGRTGAINLGADIFLCDPAGRYFGRICGYRECHARVLCEAHHCGERDHLNDDLHLVTLGPELTRSPPFVLWPEIHRARKAPQDVERLLLEPLERAQAPPSNLNRID